MITNKEIDSLLTLCRDPYLAKNLIDFRVRNIPLTKTVREQLANLVTGDLVFKLLTDAPSILVPDSTHDIFIYIMQGHQYRITGTGSPVFSKNIEKHDLLVLLDIMYNESIDFYLSHRASNRTSLLHINTIKQIIETVQNGFYSIIKDLHLC